MDDAKFRILGGATFVRLGLRKGASLRDENSDVRHDNEASVFSVRAEFSLHVVLFPTNS